MTMFDRWHTDPTYRPANLAAWAKLRCVDIATLKDPVHADDPSDAVPPTPA